MENPFKFGTIVEGKYFPDRVEEVAYIKQFIASPNHLVLISPRRFGKSSVVMRAVKQSGRQYISLNLQNSTSVSDLAAKLLREFFKVHPLEKVRHLLTHFRVVPILTTNALTGAIEVAFQPGATAADSLEDVMNLIETVSTEDNRLVIILDEFQEVADIAATLPKQLRSIMQQQQHVNYILLGSQESMMTEIFEKKKSPFYHFGQLMRLKKLPREDFARYLEERLQEYCPDTYLQLTQQILNYTDCHPYYTQQLASMVWQNQVMQPDKKDVLSVAIQQVIDTHSLDYERLWIKFNRTNKWILQRLALSAPLQVAEYPTSTIYSALKTLQKDGVVIYTATYEIEDPFFRDWIVQHT